MRIARQAGRAIAAGLRPLHHPFLSVDMYDLQRQACLGELLQVWKQLGEEYRPPSVWIAEHGPVTPAVAAHDCTYPSAVTNAWLLNDRGMQQRDPQEYVRFMTVQTGVHWAWGSPPRGIFSNTGRHPIGLAGFAPIAGTDLIVLHYIWGGLWSRGSHYRYDPLANALECTRDICLS